MNEPSDFAGAGRGGWQEPRRGPAGEERTLNRLVAGAAEPFADIDHADLDALLDRIGNARVVLLGECTHGTSEFYRMRTRITRELVQQKGFTIVAVEADWPDAATIDSYVSGRERSRDWQAFARFPTWMWRNQEVRELVDWLHEHNDHVPDAGRVRFAGLDVYSLYRSIEAVLEYLDRVDPKAAGVARHRYGCLTPFLGDAAAYGRAAATGAYRSCEASAVQVLKDLLQRRLETVRRDDEHLFDALQNARLVADAESYYRVMYYGARDSWNLRDRHMFACLERLLEFHGPDARAVVWAHNSHTGNAAATDMAARGEWNIGQLCREHFGAEAYSIGFGTDHGVVAAASHWDGAMELKQVRPALPGSYERVCHDTGIPAFLLPLRHADEGVRDALAAERLQRAIGVIYRPETERSSHYFHASLPAQFDEYVWFDETYPVHALATCELAGVPETWPFGT